MKQSSAERLSSLQEQIRACRACREQFGFEPRPVVWGSPDARIVSISQAPGASVHEIGRPFADLSGKRLRQQWYQVSEQQFYDPHLFYFTVMGHCYPGKAPRGGDRRPPGICFERWTSRELEALDHAQLYLVAGKEAAARLFPGKKLEELVFEDQTLHGKPCFVLPHPSPLNRKWFSDHPAFEQERIPYIRRRLHEVLQDDWKEDGSFAQSVPAKESWQLEKKKKRREISPPAESM